MDEAGWPCLGGPSIRPAGQHPASLRDGKGGQRLRRWRTARRGGAGRGSDQFRGDQRGPASAARLNGARGPGESHERARVFTIRRPSPSSPDRRA
eukprot:scaffold1771_cov384-Prasinococcus_capsulatus_cf.AAC.5